jgi:hypothetical protein
MTWGHSKAPLSARRFSNKFFFFGPPVNGSEAKHFTAKVVANRQTDRQRERMDRNKKRNIKRKGVRIRKKMKGSKE